eukprot:195721-Chlamydomonas_euryale.AAC.1
MIAIDVVSISKDLTCDHALCGTGRKLTPIGSEHLRFYSICIFAGACEEVYVCVCGITTLDGSASAS